ncbi:uncharacterized protein LOC144575457 [Carex rostrata]
MEDLASAFPDWANLPVMHLITEKIKCIKDYVRFRAVCHPWRFKSLSKPSHFPLQLPWLMIPSPTSRKPNDGNWLFYDLWEVKKQKIHLPEAIGKTCSATYRGWLLLVAPRGTEVFLLNPLTRVRVDLPSFSFSTRVEHDLVPIDYDEGYGRLSRSVGLLFCEEFITKITFSADLTDPNCIIMLLFESRGPFFCKVGDYCWTQVILPVFADPIRLIDAACYNGSIYLLLEYGFYIYHLNDLNNKKQIINMWQCGFSKHQKSVHFLVGNKYGLYVVTEIEYEDEEAEETIEEKAFQKHHYKPKIELYQFIDTELQVKLKRIADTNDITIFYGDHHHYLAVCADDWDSLDGSCIYQEFELYKYADQVFKHGPRYGMFCAKLDDLNSELVVFGQGNIPLIRSCKQAFWFQPTFM